MFAGIFYGCGFGGVLRSVSHGREGPWPPSQVSRVLIVTRDHSGNMSHSVHMLLGVFWLLIVANWQNTAQYMSPVSRVFIHSGHLPSGAGCVRLSKLFAPPMCCVTIFVPPAICQSHPIPIAYRHPLYTFNSPTFRGPFNMP